MQAACRRLMVIAAEDIGLAFPQIIPIVNASVDMALADVREGKGRGFPRQLQNMHADTYTQERAQGYKYPHDYPGHWVQQQYLPDDIADAKYYEYGPNKLEQAAKQYWEALKQGK